MNQGKLEVVKQEMARVNVYILGISKLKWTGMGEFNSEDNHSTFQTLKDIRAIRGGWLFVPISSLAEVPLAADEPPREVCLALWRESQGRTWSQALLLSVICLPAVVHTRRQGRERVHGQRNTAVLSEMGP